MSLPFPDDRPRVISISTSTFAKGVLIALGLWFLWFVRDIVAIVFVAVLLAALIDPFADFFARHRLPRSVAVLLVYLLLAGLLAAVIFLLVPIVTVELAQLVTAIPNSPLLDYFGQFQAFTTEYGLEENVRAALQSLQAGITNSFTSIFSTIGGVLAAVAAALVMLVLTFYMVVEEEAAKRVFKHLAPEEYQPFLSRLLSRMQKKVGSWLRGQMLLGLVVGMVAYLGLLLLDVRYALILALIAGLFEMLPYIGPVLSVMPAVLVAFGQSPGKALAVVALYVVIQQLENSVLTPKIMQKTTGLNPVVSIVVLLIGVKVGGFIGALLAIPVATMISVVLSELLNREPLEA